MSYSTKLHSTKLLFDELVIRQKLSTKCRSRRSVVRRSVAHRVTTSCACWEFGPPLAPPNILNLPTPMYIRCIHIHTLVLPTCHSVFGRSRAVNMALTSDLGSAPVDLCGKRQEYFSKNVSKTTCTGYPCLKGKHIKIKSVPPRFNSPSNNDILFMMLFFFSPFFFLFFFFFAGGWGGGGYSSSQETNNTTPGKCTNELHSQMEIKKLKYFCKRLAKI